MAGGKVSEKRYIKHVECPIRDNKGNGEIERLIRTINERECANKDITVRKDIFGLSEILFALSMYPSAKNKTPYERYTDGPRSDYNKKF